LRGLLLPGKWAEKFEGSENQTMVAEVIRAALAQTDSPETPKIERSQMSSQSASN
jgi:hypothetical protein